MDLTKSVCLSEINKCVLSSNIFEYDIEHANACALKLIKGDAIYQELILLPKEERVKKVGKMMITDKTLFRKIENLLIEWRNKFIEINKIKKENIIEITRDSVLFKGSIPPYDSIPGLDFVNFRTKNEEYSSYVYLNERIRILYDNVQKKIRIKGIKDEYIKGSKFVRKILIPTMQALEDSVSVGYYKAFTTLKSIRVTYLNSKDYEIYKDLLGDNKYKFIIDDQEVISDHLIDGYDPDMTSNFVNFIYPLLRINI